VRTRDAVTDKVGSSLDWGALAPLRLRARGAAEGIWAGPHRSLRRGAGVEFAGYRTYLPGDDLRFLDRHALMRHGTRMVREFETETDRSMRFLVDSSASMAFAGSRAPGAKLAFAAVVAAAIGWVTLRGGDRVALDWLAEEGDPLPWSSGTAAFERLVGALERGEPRGSIDDAGLARLTARVSRNTPSGAITLVLSDFLDLPESTVDALATLSSRTRLVVGLEVLDPDELDLPYQGPVRLRAMETDLVVDTDAPRARAEYQAALAEHSARLRAAFVGRGGRFLRAVTTEEPAHVVRRVLELVSGGTG
jgi:uncharacterized protein (DUF58 family)